MMKPKYVSAIFKQNADLLKTLTEELKVLGFEDISVLSKTQIEAEVRLYSTAAYAPPAPISGLAHHSLQQGHAPGIQEDLDEIIADEKNSKAEQIRQREEIHKLVEKDPFLSDKDVESLLKGSSIGLVVGALTGVGALMLPGVGPLLYAGTVGGSLASIVFGSATGMGLGALVGSLHDQELPLDLADVYNKALTSDQMVVVVRLDPEQLEEELNMAERTFARHSPLRIDQF